MPRAREREKFGDGSSEACGFITLKCREDLPGVVGTLGKQKGNSILYASDCFGESKIDRAASPE